MQKNLKLFCLLSILVFFTKISSQLQPTKNLSNIEIKWNWDKIEPIKPESLKFPNGFLFGTATSSHQIEGNCNCQWVQFEKVHNLEQSGIACDHWNRYKDDIQLMKNLGIHAYRFSIEWSKVEPVQGKFNQEAIQHYHNLIDELISNNIIPVITLHHFTHPQWFEKMGAFEKEINLPIFVNYCKKMFSEYSHKVNIWCTLNEPGVYVFQGYVRGVFPPGKSDVELAGVVSKNLIVAHINAYKTLKEMPNGDKAQIGFCHSIIQYDPYHQNNKLEKFLTYYLNHIFHDAILQFFVTGVFHYRIPTIFQLLLSGVPPVSFKFGIFPIQFKMYADVKFKYYKKNFNPKEILDFIGIQPYSHVLVNWANVSTNPSFRKDDIPTDMPYSIYPESLYRAVNQASFIGVPIYITENGIADAKDDRRELFIRRYLFALHKAIQDGYDIRGYFYWSLLDNFEWDMGFDKKFGLYEIDFKTQERKFRKGAEFYKQVIAYNNY